MRMRPDEIRIVNKWEVDFNSEKKVDIPIESVLPGKASMSQIVGAALTSKENEDLFIDIMNRIRKVHPELSWRIFRYWELLQSDEKQHNLAVSCSGPNARKFNVMAPVATYTDPYLMVSGHIFFQTNLPRTKIIFLHRCTGWNTKPVENELIVKLKEIPIKPTRKDMTEEMEKKFA